MHGVLDFMVIAFRNINWFYCQFDVNVIKLIFGFSRKDAKSQSLEPFSLRLGDFARAIFLKSLARNP